MEGAGTARRGPPRKTGPWYSRDRERLLFDRTARGFPGLNLSKSGVYRVRMEVPHYEPRNVEIRFEWSRVPRVFVDGAGSPHRYGDGSLCMWYPRDPPEERWVFEDGLLALLNHIQAHLFREAWWREHGEWLGPQAPHRPKEHEDSKVERDRSDHRHEPPR